jgi:N6-L-threonylcarbamoyladenine synthase/protein kinase Bud32
MDSNNVIYEGAEAKIIVLDDNILKKLRVKKNYRVDILDNKIRKFRNRREFKVLTKLYEGGVLVPRVYELFEEEEFAFTFEYIKGNILKKVLDKELLKLGFGEIIKMHQLEIVHGDLTTLNMIEMGKKVYLIDFGLANFSRKIEDKAVDLNLFFNCIKNEHPNHYKYKEELERMYLEEVEKSESVIRRLHQIEKRGRNK